jgi:hypothetical protein
MKLYINMWRGGKHDTQWHCSAVSTEHRIAEMRQELAELESPGLCRFLAEVEVPDVEAINEANAKLGTFQ